jgi:DNA-binding Lrp family transcriptional regulator
MSRVWELSEQKGTYLLLLLALADNADDEGYCWPSIKYLKKKIRMSMRSVINALQRLEKSGEVLINHNRRTGNRYIVTVGMNAKEREAAALKLGCEDFSSEADCITEVQTLHNRSEAAIAQESSLTVNEPSIMKNSKLDGRAHFVALSEICKIDLSLATDVQKRQIGQSVKMLKKAEVTIDQLERFSKYWYTQDWRGKKGQPPTPAQVRAEWGKFKDSGYFGEAVVGW